MKAQDFNFEVYRAGQNEFYREKLNNFFAKIKVAATPELIEIFISKADKHRINPITLASVSAVSRNITGGSGKIPFFGMIPLEQKFARFISEFYGVSFDPQADLGNFSKNIELSAAAFGFFSEVYQRNQSAAILTLFYDPDLIADAVGTGKFSETQTKILAAIYKIYSDILAAQETVPAEITPLVKPSTEPSPKLRLQDPEEEVVPTPELSVKTLIVDAADNNDATLYSKLKNPRWSDLGKNQQQELIQLILNVTVKTKLPEELRKSYAEIILRESEKNKINPLMLTALIMNESSFKEGIISKEGKIGLLQLNPADGEYYSQLISIPWNPDNAVKADYNIRFACGILKLALDIFDNDPRKAIAGYNYGIKRFIQALKEKAEIPADTIKLPAKVISLQNKWLEIINPDNFTEVPTPVPSLLPSPAASIMAEVASPVPSAAPVFSPPPTLMPVDNSPTPIPSPVASPTPQPSPSASPKPSPSPVPSAAPVVRYESADKLTQAVTCETMKNKPQCRMISEQLILFATSNDVDLLLLTALAKNLSDFQIGLQQRSADRYGIFQFQNKQMKQITYRAKVAWGGINEILELNYSLRLACKYIKYLQARFPKNTEAVIAAFISSPEKYNKKEMTENEKNLTQKTLQELNSWKKSLK